MNGTLITYLFPQLTSSALCHSLKGASDPEQSQCAAYIGSFSLGAAPSNILHSQ